MQRLFIISLLFCLMHKASAQVDSLTYFLDDGGLSNFDNVLKTDVSQILKGNVQLIWEHDISGNFRLESGIGLLTSFLHQPLLNTIRLEGEEYPFREDEPHAKMNPGFSIYLSPRYTFIKSPSYYTSTNILVEYYVKQLVIGELSITLGKEYNLSDKWILDFNAGIGFFSNWSLGQRDYHSRYIKKDGHYYGLPGMIFFPINLKLGYRLN